MKRLSIMLLLMSTLFCLQRAAAQKIKTVDNSMNAGKVVWSKQQIEAGTVPFGIPATFDFEVKNVSEENLFLLKVTSTCHCTTASFSQEPIAPGKSSIIKVTYDAARDGDFYRIVTVQTNFDTNQSVPLAITGKVAPKQDLSTSNH